MIKNYFLLPAFLCSFGLLHGQSLTPEVVATGGNYVSSPSGSISYTIGETVIPTISGGGHTLTQGFQQPNDIVSGLLDVEKDAFGAFSVYPIPAVDKLWFGYEFPAQGLVKVEVYNTLGQKMDFNLSESYESGKVIHSLDCAAYAAGQYVITAIFTATGAEPHILSKQIIIAN